jgi:hypothetical protein
MHGFKLSVLLHLFNVSQAEFAAEAGYSQPVVYRMTVGKRPIQEDDILRISAAIKRLATPERLAA